MSLKVLLIGDSSLDCCPVNANGTSVDRTVVHILCRPGSSGYNPPKGVTVADINGTGGRYYAGSSYKSWSGESPARANYQPVDWNTVLFSQDLSQYDYIVMILGANDCLRLGNGRYNNHTFGLANPTNEQIINLVATAGINLIRSIESRGTRVIYVTEYPLRTRWWVMGTGNTTLLRTQYRGLRENPPVSYIDRAGLLGAAADIQGGDPVAAFKEDDERWFDLYWGQLAAIKTAMPHLIIWDFFADDVLTRYGKGLRPALDPAGEITGYGATDLAIDRWTQLYSSEYTHSNNGTSPFGGPADAWRLMHLNIEGNAVYAKYIRDRLELVARGRQNYNGFNTM